MQRSNFPTQINKVYITFIVLKMFLILYSKTLPQADGFHPSQRCESVEETASEYFALECFIRLQGVQDYVNHAGGCLSQEGGGSWWKYHFALLKMSQLKLDSNGDKTFFSYRIIISVGQVT